LVANFNLHLAFSTQILDKATLECKTSPTITTLFPPTSPSFREWNNYLIMFVGCSCAPSPAFTILALHFDKNKQHQVLTHDYHINFHRKILLTVSISPFDWRLKTDNIKQINVFELIQMRVVLVLFSKKKLAMVISRKEGTFLIGRLITFKMIGCFKMRSISLLLYLIPNKWFTLILSFLFTIIFLIASIETT
jgi:hypothetical protein